MNKVHSKAPLRLGLAGGGTDVSPYSDNYGGAVLNSTISLYAHCEIELLAIPKLHFIAADFNEVLELPLMNEIEIKGNLVLHRAVYNKVVKIFNKGIPLPVRVTTYSDSPPGSGVGTSSSLVVSMLKTYCELLKIKISKYDLASLAYEIERIDCLLSGGKQDQYAAVFGGFNFMEFNSGNKVLVNPLSLKSEIINKVESNLLLYFTGQSRDSAKIIDEQISSFSSNSENALFAMHDIKASAYKMRDFLLAGEINPILELLGASWTIKKKVAQAITNPMIEHINLLAFEAGATSIKISGAGGGGFMMIAVDPRFRLNVINKLLLEGGHFFPFKFVNEGVESWTCG